MIRSARLRVDADTAQGESQEGAASAWPPAPRATAPLDPRLVALLSPSSFEAEPYRILLSILESRRAEQPAALVVGVTSAAPGDGKTTTSINLAAMLARLPGSGVLLLDADLRRPSIAKRLGLAADADPGLAHALRHPDLVAAGRLTPCAGLPLSVLGTSARESLPFEALHSPAFADLIHHARQAYRYVIVDTPPVVALPDARSLAALVDGFLLVVRANATPRQLLAEALEALQPERVMGLVFNGDERPYSGYYGRYLSYYQAAKLRPRD